MAAAADRRPGTSIEGSLYDLVARGKKDTFFIRDSKESENLFDARYETVPAYIPELRKIVSRNRIQWGTTCEFEIEKAGDILIEPTLLIDLPTWLPTAAAKANNNSYIYENNVLPLYKHTISFATENGIYLYDENTSNTTLAYSPPPSAKCYNVVYNGAMWIAITDGGSIYSYDGVNWSNSTNFTITGPALGPNNRNLIYANNLWVASFFNEGLSYIQTSSNGINWIQNINIPTYAINCIEYNSEYWLISGTTISNNGILYTTNPTDVSFTQTITGGFTQCRSLAWSSDMNLWVAIGTSTDSVTNIQYSSDGLNWIPASNTTNQTNEFFIAAGFAVAYGNGTWLAVGNSGDGSSVYSSTDGSNFTLINNNTQYFWDIKYVSGSQWAATTNGSGQYEFLITSDNGSNWNTAFADNSIQRYLNVYTNPDINTIEDTLVNNNRYGYTNGIAYFLFEKIQFYQDNILLQEFSGDSLFAQRHLKGTFNSSFLEDALTGVHDGSPLSIQRNATPGRLRLRLPLPFCQHADEGGLPLCATLTQQFRLRLTLRRLEDLVEAALPCSPVKPAPWGKLFGGFQALQREAIPHPTILLENRQLYIGPNAQSAFQQMNEEYIIPYSRLYENSFTFGPTDYAALQSGLPMTKRLIDGRHPAEQIFWFVRSRDDIAANRLWRFEASNATAQYYNTINLTVAGKARETDWTPLVWTDIETHAKLERDSGRSIGVMNWSYGMSHSMRGPIEMQPTGTLNFTSADRPTLYVALTAANTSNTTMNLLVDGYATYEIKKGGRGGLLYAS